MRKKLIAAVLSICMCQSLLAGCGQKAESNTKAAPGTTAEMASQEAKTEKAEEGTGGNITLKFATWDTDLRVNRKISTY